MGLRNLNCDGSHCLLQTGEVRSLPLDRQGESNAILCFHCFVQEMHWRAERNLSLSAEAKFDLPNWQDLEVYSGE